MPFSRMEPRRGGSRSQRGHHVHSTSASPFSSSSSSSSSSDDEELLSSEEDDGGPDEERGAAAALRRRRQRAQREQMRPGCCQTMLLLVPALLATAMSGVVGACRRRCCSGAARQDAAEHRHGADKNTQGYTEASSESDSSEDGFGSANELEPVALQPRRQREPQPQSPPQKKQRQRQRQLQQRIDDDDESTLSDSSSEDQFVSPHHTEPAAPAADPRRGPAQRNRQQQRRATSPAPAPAAQNRTKLSLRPAQPVQSSSSDSDSDSEDFASPTSQQDVSDDLPPSPHRATTAPTSSFSSFFTSSRSSTRGGSGDPSDEISALRRVRQHSDLRASAGSDASQPHVEEWSAHHPHDDDNSRKRAGQSGDAWLGTRGTGGAELIHQLAETLRQRESISEEADSFIDPDFPPQNSSLYRLGSSKSGSSRDGAPLGSVFLNSSSRGAHGDTAAAEQQRKRPVVWCRAAELGLKAELQYTRYEMRLFAMQLACEKRSFSKTGSGQTKRKHEKQKRFCRSASTKGKDVVGADAIRRLVEDGTLTDDTLVFFPYKTEKGERHADWHGTHRRWAECRHEFVGGELPHRGGRGGRDRGNRLKVWHDGDVRPSDIRQGLLGDCYLMAACASIALLPPEYLVHDLIIDCSDVGLFGVKFYLCGRWISVAIDDRFPCVVSGGILRPCFAQPSSDGALWTCIIEKAFAKLMGSFEAIIGGQAVDAQNYLCAGDIETLELDGGVSLTDDAATKHDSSSSGSGGKSNRKELEKEDPAEHIWRELCHRVPLPRDRETSPMVSAGGQRGSSDGGGGGGGTAAFFSCAVANSRIGAATTAGLNAEHQYSVLGAIELASSGERIIELRDPHGKCEWSGAYSVADTGRWTSALKREVLGSSRLSVPEDGSAFLSWSDFTALFSEIGVCSAFPQEEEERRGVVRRESVLGRWEAGVTAGGKHGIETFRFNPAFSLCLLRGRGGGSGRGRRRGASGSPSGGGKERVKVTLSQPDTRSMAQHARGHGGGADDDAPWEDMYLYCLTEATYERITAPRTTVPTSATASTKASRLSGRLLRSRSKQVESAADPYLPDWSREISPVLRLRRRLGQAELELEPGERYILVACAWAPGVSDAPESDRATTGTRSGGSSIAGVGNEWDFCITMHASADLVELAPLDLDSELRRRGLGPPSAEQRRQMQSLRSRDARCTVCERGFQPGDAHFEVPEGQVSMHVIL
jgi:hypothetical protein